MTTNKQILEEKIREDEDDDDESGIVIYQGYRPTDLLEKQRTERAVWEAKAEQIALEEQRRQEAEENPSNEELERRRLEAIGKKTHRRGGSSLDPARKERGQWFVEMEEKAFREAKEQKLREESRSNGKGKGRDKKDESNQDIDTEDHKDSQKTGESEVKADIKDTVVDKAAVAELLKPEFSNFLVDLGNESAQRKASDGEFAKSKKKSGISKPLPETYTRSTNFSACKWLLKLSPDLPRVRARVVCFPCIGGSATSYRRWTWYMNRHEIEVYAVQLPGRGNRCREGIKWPLTMFQVVRNLREAFKDLDILGEEVINIRGAKTIQMEYPTIFFGHGVGALIAFELAILLESELTQEELERTPKHLRFKPFHLQHLIVASCSAPQILTEFNADRFVTKYFCASRLELIERCVNLGILMKDLAARTDLIHNHIEIYRKDYELMEKYIYWREAAAGLPLSCPVSVIRAVDDVNGTLEQQEAWFELTSCKLGGILLPFKSGCSYLLHAGSSSEVQLLDVIEIICRKEWQRDTNDSIGDDENWTDEKCHDALKAIADSLMPVYEDDDDFSLNDDELSQGKTKTRSNANNNL